MGFSFTVTMKGQAEDLEALENVATILREMLPYIADKIIIEAEPDGE